MLRERCFFMVFSFDGLVQSWRRDRSLSDWPLAPGERLGPSKLWVILEGIHDLYKRRRSQQSVAASSSRDSFSSSGGGGCLAGSCVSYERCPHPRASAWHVTQVTLLSDRCLEGNDVWPPLMGYAPKVLEALIFLEALRTSKRDMAVATRGVEREIASLQLEEKKLVAEIKKTAKIGNEAATRILARQLVRLRQQITNLQGSRAQIRGVATYTQVRSINGIYRSTVFFGNVRQYLHFCWDERGKQSNGSHEQGDGASKTGKDNAGVSEAINPNGHDVSERKYCGGSNDRARASRQKERALRERNMV
ncbi:hypothetical protein KSP39_PZI021245 [Platanthera zijinensis]|uniref:Uncharacterized protein n=1 Tax=Platanthera zijinensis TaxID=2320716 RepID=A0AAP0FVY7_9ASPA